MGGGDQNASEDIGHLSQQMTDLADCERTIRTLEQLTSATDAAVDIVYDQPTNAIPLVGPIVAVIESEANYQYSRAEADIKTEDSREILMNSLRVLQKLGEADPQHILDGVGPIVSILDAIDEPIRETATETIAMVAVRYPQQVTSYVESLAPHLLDGSPTTQRNITKVLAVVSLVNPNAVDAVRGPLESAADSDDEATRAWGTIGLKQVSATPELGEDLSPDRVMELYVDGEPDRYRELFSILEIWAVNEPDSETALSVVDLLAGPLFEEDRPVATLEDMFSGEYMGRSQAADHLVAVATESDDPAVKARSVELLATAAEGGERQAAVMALTDIINEGTSPLTVGGATVALVRTIDSQFVWTTASEGIATAVSRDIAQDAAETAVDILSRILLDHQDWQLRVRAAEGLEEIAKARPTLLVPILPELETAVSSFRLRKDVAEVLCALALNASELSTAQRATDVLCAAIPALGEDAEPVVESLGEIAVNTEFDAVVDDALSGLLGALENDSSLVRRYATESLHEFLTEASPSHQYRQQAVEGLSMAQEDEDDAVRQEAIEGLVAVGRISSEDNISEMIADIREELSSDGIFRSSLVKRTKSIATGEYSQQVTHEATDLLARALEDEEESVRREAAEALADLAAENPRVVAEHRELLLDTLDGESWLEITNAAEALSALAIEASEAEAAEVVADIAEKVQSNADDTAEEAASALSDISRSRPESVISTIDVVTNALRSGAPSVQNDLARTATWVGRSYPDALVDHVDDIVAAYSNADSDNDEFTREILREELFKTIEYVAEANPEAVRDHMDVIVVGFTDSAELVRLRATSVCSKLGEIQPDLAAEYIDQLFTLLYDDSDMVQEEAADALAKLPIEPMLEHESEIKAAVVDDRLPEGAHLRMVEPLIRFPSRPALER